MLGTLEPSKKSDCKSYVGPLVHAYNCTKHESTNYSPYYLMYGRIPRLAIDIVLGLASAESAEHNYCKCVEALKSKLSAAHELADSTPQINPDYVRKKYYDVKSRCSIIDTGDRVLVKVVAFEGKHTIADKWEQEPYIVLKQPNSDVPVFEIQR